MTREFSVPQTRHARHRAARPAFGRAAGAPRRRGQPRARARSRTSTWSPARARSWSTSTATGSSTSAAASASPPSATRIRRSPPPQPSRPSKLTHTLFTVTPYENYVRVAEKLAEITPGDFEKHSILVNSGAEAVENAVKIARKYTGRRAIATLDHAFHGRTNLTMAMTYRPWPERAGMGPFPGEIYSRADQLPVPRPRGHDGRGGRRAHDRLHPHAHRRHRARRAASSSRSRATAASSSPRPATSRALSEFCTENGIVFVADEIQAGIGRTGTWYSIEHHGVVPDLVTSAKGIAGGFPLAAVTGPRRDHGCGAARRHRRHLRRQPGLDRGRPRRLRRSSSTRTCSPRRSRVEQALLARIGDWAERFAVVGEVRGKGAMFGVELVVAGHEDAEPGGAQGGARARHRERRHPARRRQLGQRAAPAAVSVVISDELIDDAATVLEEALGPLQLSTMASSSHAPADRGRCARHGAGGVARTGDPRGRDARAGRRVGRRRRRRRCIAVAPPRSTRRSTRATSSATTASSTRMR